MISVRTTGMKNKTRGFTLLELIVSLGLFTIVVTIAMSAYLSLIALDRKARATNDLVTNLSFVIESMSHDVRTGTVYACGGFGAGPNCWGVNGGSNVFSYINERSEYITYRLMTTGSTAGSVGVCIGAGSPPVCNDSTATILTDPRIRVTNLTFYTQGVGTGDGIQPRVLFTVTGTITPDQRSTPVTFTLEGGATERLIEL